MSYALVIGDLHYSKSTLQRLAFIEQNIMLKITHYKPSVIIMLGDIFDEHNIVDISAAEQFNVFLKSIESLQFVEKIFILVGNHDRRNNRYTNPSVHSLSYYYVFENSKIKIVQEPIYVSLSQNLDACMVPYVPEGTFKEHLDKLEPNDADVYFGHQEFYGVTFNRIKSTSKDSWSADKPLMISGHIHDECTVSENLYYPGTPMQISFGENTNKQVILIDMNKKVTLSNLIHLPMEDIPLLIKKDMKYSELSSFIFESKHTYRITIKDTVSPDQMQIVYELRKKGNIKITIETKPTTLKKEPLTVMADSFTKVLRDSLTEKEYALFSMIFGK